MLITIHSRYSDRGHEGLPTSSDFSDTAGTTGSSGIYTVIIEGDFASFRAALSTAISRSILLERAMLHGAALSAFDFTGTNLDGADLSDADVSDALFVGADMHGSCLRGADLTDADLTDADLRGADFINATLTGAVFAGTVLDPNAVAIPPTEAELLSAGFELSGSGASQYVLGWRTAVSQHAGRSVYAVQDDPYTASVFSIDDGTSCHPGIYLASAAWLDKHYTAGTARRQVRCLRSELIGAGFGLDRKYRCKRLWVVA